MTKHEDSGRLMAYLDGELAPEEATAARAHVARCPRCAEALARLGTERTRLIAALAELEAGSGSDLAAAGARVRLRIEQRRRAAPPAVSPSPGSPGRVPAPPSPSQQRPRPAAPGRRPARWARRSRLLQAAVLVLFVAGGLSALVPGSPVRRWIEGGAGPEAQPAAAPTAAPQETPPPPPPMWVRVEPEGGRIRIALDIASGAELEVALVEGENATVYATPDASFRVTAEGGLEGAIPSGPVRVELPSGTPDVSLEVGGRLYVRVQGSRLEPMVPTIDQAGAEVSFRIP